MKLRLLKNKSHLTHHSSQLSMRVSGQMFILDIYMVHIFKLLASFKKRLAIAINGSTQISSFAANTIERPESPTMQINGDQIELSAVTYRLPQPLQTTECF